MESTTLTDWRLKLQAAQQHAQHAHFDAFLATCHDIVNAHGDDLDTCLSVASLLASFGFVSSARNCYLRARAIASNNIHPIMGLANLARDIGDHAECWRLYDWLLKHLPEHDVIRRNALLSLEYDPDATDEDRFRRALEWGGWAMKKVGGECERPSLRPLADRPLRVGYVSADFCQHTVGLFVNDVLAAHDKTRVATYAYSAGQVDDWVTKQVRASCVFRNVSGMDDQALADQIRRDEIDVLVDLSGHTAGSRLTVFAHRPAPIQVSWLGYFATTGLPVMDAVLLDEWHAPRGTEAQFVERIVRLPGGRFSYTPVPFAPRNVAPPPCLSNAYVTFGCFNNTGKLNAGVYDVWSRILAAVPNSRLVLKWRSFHDETMCERVRACFAHRGISPGRIELRGASFHAEVLKQYADVDIALDPFPFTGGLTSCEAMWMGVPVVTWPQSRVASRQTHAYLSAIGLSNLSAEGADHYVQIAIELASDARRLESMRNSMRERMRMSSLCDSRGLARQLEEAFWRLATSDTYENLPRRPDLHRRNFHY